MEKVSKVKQLEKYIENWQYSYEKLLKEYTITRKELLRYRDMWFKLRDFVERTNIQVFLEMQNLEKADGKEKQHEKNIKKIVKQEVPPRKRKSKGEDEK